MTTINLMITERCPFQCGHCFFESGPRRPKDYMTWETLQAIHYQITTLQEAGYDVTVNLIGGEPTINLEEFRRVLDVVERWDVPLEMSTNGWWLTKRDKAEEFLQIVKHPVLDERLTIRISDDYWHREYQPKNIRGRLDAALKGLWDNYDENEDPYSPLSVLPEPSPGNPWIFVETWGDRDKYDVIPTGRANDFGFHDHKKHLGWCPEPVLTYHADGRLGDICCKGSKLEVGTVADDPLVLIERIYQFHDDTPGKTCKTCWAAAAEWKKAKGL